jgi:hypothetical protein
MTWDLIVVLGGAGGKEVRYDRSRIVEREDVLCLTVWICVAYWR